MDPFVWIGCFTTRIMSVSALQYFCLIVIFHMFCFCFPRIDNMYIFSTLLRIVVNEYNYKYKCKCHRKHSQQTNFNWHFSFQWWYFFCLFARVLFFSAHVNRISLDHLFIFFPFDTYAPHALSFLFCGNAVNFQFEIENAFSMLSPMSFHFLSLKAPYFQLIYMWLWVLPFFHYFTMWQGLHCMRILIRDALNCNLKRAIDKSTWYNCFEQNLPRNAATYLLNVQLYIPNSNLIRHFIF